MLYYATIIVIIALFCYLEYSDKKSDYLQVKELSEHFDK